MTASENSRDDWYFTILRRDIEQAPLSALLDMLRYDQATVALDDGGVVVLRTHRRMPTRPRWDSFGLTVWESQPLDPSDDPHAIARRTRERAPAHLLTS